MVETVGVVEAKLVGQLVQEDGAGEAPRETLSDGKGVRRRVVPIAVAEIG